MKSLFPKINESYRICDSDIKYLLARLNSISKQIKYTRHYFNHKYEESVVERYKSSLDEFSLDKIEKISDELFSIVSDLGLIHRQTSYGKSDSSHEMDISNQIDLILFGTIHSAIHRFYEVSSKDAFYWDARENFFKSDGILDIISTE